MKKNNMPSASEIFTKDFLIKIGFYIVMMVFFIITGFLLGQEANLSQAHDYANTVIITYCGNDFFNSSQRQILNYSLPNLTIRTEDMLWKIK